LSVVFDMLRLLSWPLAKIGELAVHVIASIRDIQFVRLLHRHDTSEVGQWRARPITWSSSIIDGEHIKDLDNESSAFEERLDDFLGR